jgi:hypothetical protein
MNSSIELARCPAASHLATPISRIALDEGLPPEGMLKNAN